MDGADSPATRNITLPAPWHRRRIRAIEPGTTMHDMRCDLIGGGVGDVGVKHRCALSDHRDLIGQCHDLADLVADEQDRGTGVAQAAQQREQLVHLRRGQNGGRFIQDQHPAAAPEQADDLDELADMDRHTAGAAMPVDMRPDAVSERLALGFGAAPVDTRDRAKRAGDGFVTQHQVFQKAQVRGHHEFLVHHADAPRQRVARTGQAHGRIVDYHMAVIGHLHPLQHPHQGGFSRTVFAHDRMNRPCRHGDGYAAIGPNLAVGFVQIHGAERDGGGGGGHWCVQRPGAASTPGPVPWISC
jgi:hypothetical protein